MVTLAPSSEFVIIIALSRGVVLTVTILGRTHADSSKLCHKTSPTWKISVVWPNLKDIVAFQSLTVSCSELLLTIPICTVM